MTPPDAGVMADLGVFSRILQDAETVYVSIDSSRRFTELLNFLQNVAEDGYDLQTELMARPDAVTVATVHKMKGLEFPAVFVSDVEAQRFPPAGQDIQRMATRRMHGADPCPGCVQRRRQPQRRGTTLDTAITRAERYLYITGKREPAGCSAGPTRVALLGPAPAPRTAS